MEGEGYVHSVDRGGDGWDGKNDGEGSEEFNGSIDVVCEDDLIGVAERSDAFDIDAADVLGLAEGNHEVFEEVDVFLIEGEVAAPGDVFKDVAHGDKGGQVLVEDLFVFREDDDRIAIDDLHQLLVIEDRMAHSLNVVVEVLSDLEEDVEKQFRFLGCTERGIAGDKVFHDLTFVGADRNHIGGGQDHGEGVGIKAEFSLARMADEEEDIFSDILDTGEFVFIKAVADIGEF